MPLELKVTEWSTLSPAQATHLLQRPATRNPGLSDRVAEIVGRVRAGGDRALAELTREFDGMLPDALALTEQDLRAAAERIDPELVQAIRDAVAASRQA